MGGYQNNFAQPAFSPGMQSKGKEPVTEQFDEAAFERAFDMAKEDMMADSEPQMSGLEKDKEGTEAAIAARAEVLNNFQAKHEAEARLAERSEEPHQVNQDDVQDFSTEYQERVLPQETILETQQEPTQNSREDDDALAATAQELLEKVENNQTDKFRNSQFLGLMRRLRDREVKVEGDKMVETVSATQIHPKRTLTPDSGYESGMSTPHPNNASSSSSPNNVPHNPTICKVPQCDVLEDHRWDHWESPYS